VSGDNHMSVQRGVGDGEGGGAYEMRLSMRERNRGGRRVLITRA